MFASSRLRSVRELLRLLLLLVLLLRCSYSLPFSVCHSFLPFSIAALPFSVCAHSFSAALPLALVEVFFASLWFFSLLRRLPPLAGRLPPRSRQQKARPLTGEVVESRGADEEMGRRRRPRGCSRRSARRRRTVARCLACFAGGCGCAITRAVGEGAGQAQFGNCGRSKPRQRCARATANRQVQRLRRARHGVGDARCCGRKGLVRRRA